MIKRKDDFLSAQTFEKMLQQCVEESTPPRRVLLSVNPWEKATSLVVAGFAMALITLNIGRFSTAYWLPFIGILCLYFGFRMLWRENRWFNACRWLSVVRFVLHFVQLLINASILWEESPLLSVLKSDFLLQYTIMTAMMLCLWRAVLALQKKAGQKPGAWAIPALAVWYGIFLLLGKIHYSGLLIGWWMIITFFYILYQLSQLFGQMRYVGYVIRPAKVRLPEWVISLLLITVTLLSLLVVYLTCNRYPMDWQPVDLQQEKIQQEEIAKYLDSLGMPQHVLRDMGAEDLAQCADALWIEVSASHESIEDRASLLDTALSLEIPVLNTVSRERNLFITNVAVKLGEEPGRWQVIHHFRITKPLKVFTTEMLLLQNGNPDAVIEEGSFTGRVFYEKDGQTYEAPYYRLEEQMIQLEISNYLPSIPAIHATAAQFSYPLIGEERRGYITYELRDVGGWENLGSVISYCHQSNFWVYPAQEAIAWQKQGEGFLTVDSQLLAAYEQERWMLMENK